MSDDRIVFQASRLKWQCLSLGFGLFTAVSGLLLAIGERALSVWVGFVLFGLAALACLAKLAMRPDTLRLDPEGFTYTLFGRRTRYAWRDCSSFWPVFGGVVGELTGSGRIGFRYSDPKAERPRERVHLIPETYGVGGRKLAALMSQRRENVLGGRGACAVQDPLGR